MPSLTISKTQMFPGDEIDHGMGESLRSPDFELDILLSLLLVSSKVKLRNCSTGQSLVQFLVIIEGSVVRKWAICMPITICLYIDDK